MADLTAEERLSLRSKENRWYHKDIDDHIRPSSRRLLEEYSHIPTKDIDAHIHKLRDILWEHAPYPCVGEFKFLTLNLRNHPQYQHILSLLKEPPSSAQDGPYMLDLGCCVAQELRSLAYTGIPSSNLYGSDMIASYLTTSYDLFNDKEHFKGTLVPANIFSETLFEKEYQGWEGKFKVVHAGLFLHLFSWEQQIAACQNIMKLMSPEKGSMFLGEMVGCEGGGVRGSGVKKFWKEGEQRKQYLHDKTTFEKMWTETAEKAGTNGQWKVEGQFKLRKNEADEVGSKGCGFFVGEGVGWLTFSVERV